jgi:hypothetical protein
MQYIQLNNDTFILNTSKGVYTLTRESFHYKKIKALVIKEADESQVLPLLKPVSLPNGIYKGYASADGVLFYTLIHNTAVTASMYIHGTEVPDNILHTAVFLGVYSCLQDLIDDHPEYVI